VFGSIARNRARQDSDLDVAVQAEKPLDSAMRVQLIGQLALAIGCPVDLIDLRTIGEPSLGQTLANKPTFPRKAHRLAKTSSRHAKQEQELVYNVNSSDSPLRKPGSRRP